MRLTQTLLGYLNRVFSRDPQQFLAIQFKYAGSGMSWSVEDGTLTVLVTGGVGAGFSLDLSEYTLQSLASHIAGLPGFTVTGIATSDQSGLSAMVLLDGTGSQNASGGNNLYAYGNPLYSYLESAAKELEDAETAVVEALKQLSIRDAAGNPSASGYWLDQIGSYYNVPRLTGEPDNVYGPRIIAEVLRPRANNVALEAAIKSYTGQAVTVTDVSVPGFNDPTYNSLHTHNGTALYNSVGSFQYGLFDVTIGYDIIGGGEISGFRDSILGVIERLRDAGTHLRALSLGGSVISDTFLSPPSDDMGGLVVTPGLTDTLTAPTESGVTLSGGMTGFAEAGPAGNDGTSSLVAVYTTTYNSLRNFNGAVPHMGGHTGTSNLDGSGLVVT